MNRKKREKKRKEKKIAVGKKKQSWTKGDAPTTGREPISAVTPGAPDTSGACGKNLLATVSVRCGV